MNRNVAASNLNIFLPSLHLNSQPRPSIASSSSEHATTPQQKNLAETKAGEIKLKTFSCRVIFHIGALRALSALDTLGYRFATRNRSHAIAIGIFFIKMLWNNLVIGGDREGNSSYFAFARESRQRDEWNCLHSSMGDKNEAIDWYRSFSFVRCLLVMGVGVDWKWCGRFQTFSQDRILEYLWEWLMFSSGLN